MSDYTKMKYVVATKKTNRIESFYFACDDLDQAEAEYNKEYGNNVEYVKIYNRSQWNGSRRRCMKTRRLLPNNSSIPASVGMWLVNQAGSDML